MPGCDRVREALSAALDGEARPIPADELDAHLAACRSCGAYARDLPALARATRVAAADEVPDLRSTILAMAAADRERRTVAGPPRRTYAQRRVVAALAGVVQLALAVPVLAGSVDVHLARDLAASEVALGVVFLLAAWRPAQATALAAVATVFAAVGLVASAAALVDGAAPTSEVGHLLPVVGAAVVWSLTDRGAHGTRRARPTPLAGPG